MGPERRPGMGVHPDASTAQVAALPAREPVVPFPHRGLSPDEGAAGVRSSSAKNLVKRWSRRLFAAGSRILALGRPAGAPGVRILTYHRIAADPGDPFAVAPQDFARQMEVVARTGRVVDLGTALSGLRAGDRPVSQIVVSFDDGTRDFLTEAAPVLSRLGIPAVIYVNPSSVGEAGFLGWNDLLDL